MAINVIIEYTCLDYKSNFSYPPIKAFMDDMFLMSPTIENTQHLLSRCTLALNWAGMSFRADKSRGIDIVKGKVENVCPFSVYISNDNSENIPSIHAHPVRFLGRTIASSLSDLEAVQKFISNVHDGLSLIDKFSHKGMHKVWILHHLLIPRARWPLLIYEVSISCVLKLEQKVSFYLRRWLELHHSITNISLYSSISPCPLPLKSLSSIFKVSQSQQSSFIM